MTNQMKSCGGLDLAFSAVETVDDDLFCVFDAMDQGVLWLDKNQVVKWHNLAYRKLLEINDKTGFIGQSFQEVIQFLLNHGEFTDINKHEGLLAESMRSVQSGGQSHRIERVRPNGTILSISAVPLVQGGYAYTYLDITRERRAQEFAQRNAKSTVLAMANLAEHRDTDTGAHVLRVARLVRQTTWQLRCRGYFNDIIDDAYIEQVGTASILHDVGKMAMPDHILFKAGVLNEEERTIIKLHPTIGSQLVRQASFIMDNSTYLVIGADIAQSHHEWFDGSGYPSGLSGENIPLAGRICAIADVFDALTSRRPYKSPWKTTEALEHLRKQSGTQFDPVVTEAFISVIERREQVSIVRWSDSMSVGDPHIDEQHQILIDIINHLASAESQNDRPVVEMIIDELMSYAAYHFLYEEQLMESGGFPGLQEHRKIHQDFVLWVTGVREEFINLYCNQLGERILNFLRDWLRDHILVEDRLYCPFIRR